MKPRWILLGALLPYVVWLIFGYRYHFMDGVNLLLHEAGHVFFAVFGRTAHFLGGTLGQLLFPAMFAGYFWYKRQRFEAYVVLVWLAESLMYAAEYIGDARRMALPLVGGHIHDWNWLLTRWRILDKAEELGNFVHVVASLLAVPRDPASEAPRAPIRLVPRRKSTADNHLGPLPVCKKNLTSGQKSLTLLRSACPARRRAP